MQTFISQFAEKANPTLLFSSSLGTATMTATKEGADHDVHGYNLSSLGTQTLTETIEGTDQDRCCDFWH